METYTTLKLQNSLDLGHFEPQNLNFFLNKIKNLTLAPSGQSWQFRYVNKSWYQWNAIFPHQDHIQPIFGQILLSR